MPLQISTPEKEGSLLVSKLLKIPMLLDAEEMNALLSDLNNTFPNFSIFPVSGFAEEGKEKIPLQTFISTYSEYVAAIKKGDVPEVALYRNIFSVVFSIDDCAVYAFRAGNGRLLIKPKKPVVQIQPHHFIYSKESNEFKTMVFSKQSISWGLQFSYPQLFQDAKTHEISTVLLDPHFTNTALFKHIQHWVRKNTLPTPFLVDGKRHNHSMRLGKMCFSWINSHIQLAHNALSIGS